MTDKQQAKPASVASRRRFLAETTAIMGATATSLNIARSAHASGDDVLKVGLIGCGGRGSGAAANALNAGEDVRLVAMADLFGDKLQASRERLKNINPKQVQVDDDHCFTGFDGYEKVIASDVDVVIIACASHFHPAYLEAAVKAGKTRILRKAAFTSTCPVFLRVRTICEEAKKKGLSIVSGLCWRYHLGMRETMKRVHDGAIGDIVAIQETYVVGPYRVTQRDPAWSEMEWQMRNWYHFNWLAGDQILQQLIHSIDKGAWVMNDEPPVKAWGMGGRSNCFGTQYGDLFDHQAIVFEYANGVNMFGFCRNHTNCHNELSDRVFGTKGVAHLIKHQIEGPNEWRYEGPKPSMYDVEHKELFESIRNNRPINNGNYMFGSTMLALLGQFVCHTGRRLTWEEALESEWSVELPRYGFDVEPPIKANEAGSYDIAIPGITPMS